MRIAVMGAGGIGGYFGGLLAHSGNEVTLIARGPHLEAIRANGLTVRGQREEFSLRVEATDDPTDVGPVELVLHTVKTYQDAGAVPSLRPMVSEDITILALQNGVEAHEELAQAVGSEAVLLGAAYIEAQIESPGVIRQRSEIMRIVFGEADGQRTPRAERILDTLQAAGIPTELSPDVEKVLWTKFLFISTLAGVTSAARAPLSLLLAHPESRETVLGRP